MHLLFSPRLPHGIHTHKSLTSNGVFLNSYMSFEHHAFTFSSSLILCININSPSHHSTSFINEFSELLSIIHTSYSRILINWWFYSTCWCYLGSDIQRVFLNLLNCLDFEQHVMQPTHNRGHTLDLAITHGLSIGVSSVANLAVSNRYCVFFHITSFNQDEAPVRTVRWRYLTSEVAANFMGILQSTAEFT